MIIGEILICGEIYGSTKDFQGNNRRQKKSSLEISMSNINNSNYAALNINDYFIIRKLDNFWRSQETDWSCGLASTNILLNYLGIRVTESSLIKSLKELRLKIFNFGILTSYIPILFLQNSVKIIYRTNINYFTELEPYDINKNLREVVNRIVDKCSKNSIKHHLYKSLSILLDLDGKIIIYKKTQYPNVNHIINNLYRDVPLIVGTTAKDFYRINEKWGHTLALIPYQAKYWIQDPYHFRGYSEYESWSKNLTYSKKYDWNTWSDELIEVSN
jgi:hypothetical protein